MGRFITRALLVGAAWTIAGAVARAQTTTTNHAVETHGRLGVLAAVYHSPAPDEPPGALGAFVSYDFPVLDRLSVRATATIMRSAMSGDAVTLCRPMPAGGCRPASIFPNRMYTMGAAAIGRPFERLPLTLLAGVDFVATRGGRLGDSGPVTSGVDGTARAALRWGAEVPLWPGAHALRMQLSRTRLNAPAYALRAFTQLSLALAF